MSRAVMKSLRSQGWEEVLPIHCWQHLGQENKPHFSSVFLPGQALFYQGPFRSLRCVPLKAAWVLSPEKKQDTNSGVYRLVQSPKWRLFILKKQSPALLPCRLSCQLQGKAL